MSVEFFFFNDTATTEIYTLSLHDALPICGYYYAPDPSSQQICSIGGNVAENSGGAHCLKYGFTVHHVLGLDRKSTRLNSSHANISYAVFCLQKNKAWLKGITGLDPVTSHP